MYKVDFPSSVQAASLDRLAVEENGHILSLRGGDAERGSIPPTLPGGWGAIWVGTGRGPNWGSLVLVARDARTRALLHEGRVAHAIKAGLTAQQAQKWAASKIPWKHELLPWVVAILKNRYCVEAVRRWGTYSSPKEWRKRWASVFDEEPSRLLSARRMDALASMIEELAR